GDVVVLLDAVAADAEAADEISVEIKRRRAGEEDDAALIRIRRLRALAARIGEVVQKQRVERTVTDLEDIRVDAGRVERLRPKTDGAIRHGRAGRYDEIAVADDSEPAPVERIGV